MSLAVDGRDWVRVVINLVFVHSDIINRGVPTKTGLWEVAEELEGEISRFARLCNVT
ncbi:hypothetical protein D3C75_1178380 [compost metagenome]